MKVISIAPENIVINPDIATRKGEHDKDSIDRIAKSYMQRFEDNMDPVQINPLLVRALNGDDGKFELIDGRGRLDAALLVNELDGLGGKPMQLQAVVMRAEDEGAIISGIQANFHEAVDVFDQADAMAKLEALGKKQKEIAKIFGVSEGQVSQLLKLNKCPKKYVQAYRDGDLEKDAVIAIADMDTSDAQRTEIFEEASRHANRITDILAKKEHRDRKAQLDAEIEQTKARAEELKQKAKDAEKAAKEAEKLLAKTKDENELKEARKIVEKAKKDQKVAGVEWTKAEKEKEKLKEQKEKLVANPPSTKKKAASAEDVRDAARGKGVKGVSKAPKGKAQLVAEMEAMTENKDKPMPESACKLIGKIEGFLDGDHTAAELEKAFRAYCKPDSK